MRPGGAAFTNCRVWFSVCRSILVPRDGPPLPRPRADVLYPAGVHSTIALQPRGVHGSGLRPPRSGRAGPAGQRQAEAAWMREEALSARSAAWTPSCDHRHTRPSLLTKGSEKVTIRLQHGRP